jgi:hypothetical protein
MFFTHEKELRGLFCDRSGLSSRGLLIFVNEAQLAETVALL